MQTKQLTLACLIFTLGLAASAVAQEAPSSANTRASDAQRPKIGLVLSGGGARGAAHIGVLKVLEELQVPIDLIVGTSMGSIVGAAYATGLSVEQMEKVIKTITTDRLFTDNPPRQDQTMRRKDDDLRPYFVPELAVTPDGVLLPKGLVTGVALEGELRRLVQVTSARSFDELPIPFRAIATDIGTGEMVVLKEGSVVQAIRASMSVPGAVAPVEMGRRQLVDGGLVRNLPIDIARSMGAEVIIAVNLGTPLLKPEQITSALTVSVQMLNILTEQNVGRSLAELTAARHSYPARAWRLLGSRFRQSCEDGADRRSRGAQSNRSPACVIAAARAVCGGACQTGDTGGRSRADHRCHPS